MAIEIFISYAHEDEVLMTKLRNQLIPFVRTGLIDTIWYDRNISAGEKWDYEIDQHLNDANIILLLISADFIASDYCYSIEMTRALERYASGEARVIPVILKPIHWKKILGEIQSLPKDGIPVTEWVSIDSALFDVAKGIQKVIEEITIQLLARKISLFGYETDGGTNSALWQNPLKFSFNAHKNNYEDWWKTKRNFTKEEIINQTWIKVSNYGDYWTVHFLPDGYLTEGSLSDPGKRWEGSWKLIDGMLRINISKYEVDVFANLENSTYSAIEFDSEQNAPFAHHVFFPFQESRARHWDMNDAFTLIAQICEQVVNREAKPVDFVLFGSLLHRGEISVRDAVKLLGLSPDYRKRFISTRSIDEAIDLCYEHFLSRKADGDGKLHYINKVKKTGFDAIIVELINSGEYKREFSEDNIPSRHWLETSVNSIRVGLASPKPMATIHQSPILAKGRIEGLPPIGRYFIIAYVITDIEYEQGKALINRDDTWIIDNIYLRATSHRLFFRIVDENKKLVAESKEITIFRR